MGPGYYCRRRAHRRYSVLNTRRCLIGIKRRTSQPTIECSIRRFRLLPASNSWDCMYRKSSNENCSSPVIKDFSGHWRKLIKITEASLSISSVSSVACTYMWSNGVGTVSIRMARKISSTLINIWDIKGFWEYDAYINLLMLNVECIYSSCFPVGGRIFIFFHWWKILRQE